MNEKLLQHIWLHKLFDTTNCQTIDGEKIKILSVGEKNTNSGPDFSQVKIQMEETLWAGCVEIHIKSSDWILHNHHTDKSYENVVLHVVYEHDKDIFSANGNKIPTLELKSLIPQKVLETYCSYMESKHSIPCYAQFKDIDTFRLYAWLDRLLIDRLEEKTQEVKSLLENSNHHIEESFYVFLASYFGFNINKLPFQLLAKTTPLIFLAKHKNNLLQLEAMLFGQAGLLEDEFGDEYPRQLQKEYHFLKQKFNLQPLCQAKMWKFSRTFPPGFPTIRIAQLAALIHSSSALFSKIMEAEHVMEIKKWLQVKASAYWETHYLFDLPSAKKEKILGENAIYSLIINAILPFMYHIATEKELYEVKNKVLLFYEQLPLEKNTIVNCFLRLKKDFSTAFHSQALIQLKKKYCDTKECLRCAIGISLLKME